LAFKPVVYQPSNPPDTFWQPPRHQNPINTFILAFKSAVCQPSNPPNNLQTKAPRPAGTEATYYVPTNIISHKRQGRQHPNVSPFYYFQLIYLFFNIFKNNNFNILFNLFQYLIDIIYLYIYIISILISLYNIPKYKYFYTNILTPKY
jgi:hypothetical protein